MNKSMKIFIWAVFFSWIFISCEQLENCQADSSKRDLRVAFFKKKGKSPIKVGFKISSGKVNAAGTLSKDSLKANLTLNHLVKNQTFTFKSDTSSYSLQIKYQPVFSVLDEKCPPSLQFDQIDTLRHSFDSLVIKAVSTEVQNDPHIEVYF